MSGADLIWSVRCIKIIDVFLENDMELVTSKLPNPCPQSSLRGQKRPLRPPEVWAIRARLEMKNCLRDLALFNLAIDSKLRACDLVRLRVEDVAAGSTIRDRAMVVQKKTQRPVHFEIGSTTASSLKVWIGEQRLQPSKCLFPSRVSSREHLSERQYNRIVLRWVTEIGLDPANYGTHSLRRTKATEIYRKTGNLRAVQLLLGHAKIESTVRYLGVDVEDALQIAGGIEL